MDRVLVGEGLSLSSSVSKVGKAHAGMSFTSERDINLTVWKSQQFLRLSRVDRIELTILLRHSGGKNRRQVISEWVGSQTACCPEITIQTGGKIVQRGKTVSL